VKSEAPQRRGGETARSGKARTRREALQALTSGSLSRSGAIAATAVGAAAVGAGWRWAVLLLVYFVTTSALSRWGGEVKALVTSGLIAKTGSRDAVQVLANGGVFAVAAFAAAWAGSQVPWVAIGAGALAASAADSWATEVGVLSTRAPRSILTGKAVPAGTSGGVSVSGTLAAVAGAAMVGLCAFALGWGRYVAGGAALGGIAGAFADSLLGATIQSRRWCPSCASETEQPVHRCGTVTVHHRGLGWIDNDGVNLIATLVGAAVAWMATR
jgi:uncharacterized protein (TIGR00297 family)